MVDSGINTVAQVALPLRKTRTWNRSWWLPALSWSFKRLSRRPNRHGRPRGIFVIVGAWRRKTEFDSPNQHH